MDYRIGNLKIRQILLQFQKELLIDLFHKYFVTLKTVTSRHLQQFMDLLSFGGTVEDFVSKGYSIDYVRSYSAVLQQSFRFAVFPKQYITFNPMQYVVMRHKKDDMDLFAEETDTDNGKVKPLSFEQYQKLTAQLGKRSKDAILPVQINVYAHATREAKRESAKLLDKVVGMN